MMLKLSFASSVAWRVENREATLLLTVTVTTASFSVADWRKSRHRHISNGCAGIMTATRSAGMTSISRRKRLLTDLRHPGVKSAVAPSVFPQNAAIIRDGGQQRSQIFPYPTLFRPEQWLVQRPH